MATFTIKLVRPMKHVVLNMQEGLPLTKDEWSRIASESNSKLKYESGAWENWILGSPGGDRNLRLYDPSDTKSAMLKKFMSGRSEGEAIFLFEDFGAVFGGEPCRWFLM